MILFDEANSLIKIIFRFKNRNKVTDGKHHPSDSSDIA